MIIPPESFFNYTSYYCKSTSYRNLTDIDIMNQYEWVDRFILSSSYDLSKSNMRKMSKTISCSSDTMYCFIEQQEEIL